MLHIYVKKSQVFVAVPPPHPPPPPASCRTTCVVIEPLAWLLNCYLVTELIVFCELCTQNTNKQSKKNYDLLCKVDKTNDSGA